MQLVLTSGLVLVLVGVAGCFWCPSLLVRRARAVVICSVPFCFLVPSLLVRWARFLVSVVISSEGSFCVFREQIAVSGSLLGMFSLCVHAELCVWVFFTR